MSHEIMTPLSGILGLTELLTEGHLSPDQQEQLINLQESCLTLKNIVDDLLDFKILEHGKVRFRNAPCDCLDVINSLVAKCEPIVTGELTHITHVNSQCSSHLRMGDRTRFEQVIVNLVNNAIKFTQEGEVEIETFINDAGVTVIVSDTGIGMKSDQLERIFEDFTQADEKISTRYGGSGLGLSIVRSIMDQLGGSIVVTSEFDKGSRFTVMFPLPAATEEDLQVIPIAKLALQLYLCWADEYFWPKIAGSTQESSTVWSGSATVKSFMPLAAWKRSARQQAKPMN